MLDLDKTLLNLQKSKANGSVGEDPELGAEIRSTLLPAQEEQSFLAKLVSIHFTLARTLKGQGSQSKCIVPGVREGR